MLTFSEAKAKQASLVAVAEAQQKAFYAAVRKFDRPHKPGPNPRNRKIDAAGRAYTRAVLAHCRFEEWLRVTFAKDLRLERRAVRERA